MEHEGKEDLRVKKTRAALLSTLPELLNKRNFNKITTNDLCKEAMVCRAAFYSHFKDKYDLLRVLLAGIRKEITKDVHRYDKLEKTVNDYIQNNKKIVKNILQYANKETLDIMQEFLSGIVDAFVKRSVTDTENVDSITLFNFFTGGLLQLLLWQTDNDFPPEKNMLDGYLYKMMRCVSEWDAAAGGGK